MNGPVYVIDETGVETLWADRDAAWLIAVAAQIDQDFARELDRTIAARKSLSRAVAELADRGGR